MSELIEPTLLGHKVRELVSSYEGICNSYVEFMTGTRQYSLVRQVLPSEASLPEERSFDVQQLEVLTDKPVVEVLKRQVMDHLELGNEVIDLVTGFKGIAVKRYTFLNGCVYYLIIGKVNKDNKVEEMFTEQSLVKYVGKGVKPIQHKPKAGKTEKGPGGPSLLVPQRRF